MKNNPIPAEYSQYGSFTILAENNRKQIQGLIEELAATQHEVGSVAQKSVTCTNRNGQREAEQGRCSPHQG